MITLDDIKLGIELNGLDETLKRICDTINDEEKQIKFLRETVIKNSVESLVNTLNDKYSKCDYIKFKKESYNYELKDLHDNQNPLGSATINID